MAVEFDVSVDEEALIYYKFYHKYHTLSGWCELILGVIMIVLGIDALLNLEEMNISFALLAMLFGIVFLVVIPVQMVLHAKKSAPLPQMHYLIDDKGITVSVDEHTAHADWVQVYRVKNTNKYIFIYFTPTRANIIPKSCIEDKLDSVNRILAKRRQ